jgi:predicted O-methyltransferase YrrM
MARIKFKTGFSKPILEIKTGIQSCAMNFSPPLLETINDLDALRHSRDDHWQIPRDEGDMLFHLALSSRAKVIVEVGTSYGFSGLFWAAALQQTGGKLHTIDINRKKYDSSKATFAKAGLSHIVSNYLGDALQIIPAIPGPIDLAFIDADKPLCRAFFDLLWPKISPGGAIITDNATTHREELAEYIACLRSIPNASSVEVAVGNGIEWTIRFPVQ